MSHETESDLARAVGCVDDVERELWARVYAAAFATFAHPPETINEVRPDMEHVTIGSDSIGSRFHVWRPVGARVRERQVHAETLAREAVIALRRGHL